MYELSRDLWSLPWTWLVRPQNTALTTNNGQTIYWNDCFMLQYWQRPGKETRAKQVSNMEKTSQAHLLTIMDTMLLFRQTRSRSHVSSPPTTHNTSNSRSVSSMRILWTLSPCQNFLRSQHGSLTNSDSPSTSPYPCWRPMHRNLDQAEEVDLLFSKICRKGIVRAMWSWRQRHQRTRPWRNVSNRLTRFHRKSWTQSMFSFWVTL